MTLPALSNRGVLPQAEASDAASPDELYPEEALKRALELARTSNPAPQVHLKHTTHRSITKRAVMWLGQTCNLRCYFCYFLDRIETKEHPEHEFMSIEKAKEICDGLVNTYGNSAIDIQGGEPTIWKPIYELVEHCHKIGLHPTLITNALVLDNKDNCLRFKEAGIRDFLISVHGIGEVHDRVVVRKGAHVRQMNAIRNLQEVGIPFRFNCVLSKPVVPQLPAVAKLAVETGARVVNFLAFNPFEDQAKGGRRSAQNVPSYSEVMTTLTEALDILDKAGIEANVRYYPICMFEERHRKSAYDFQQLSYDHHEWDYASWSWTGQQPQRMSKGPPSIPPPMSSQRFFWTYRKLAQKVASFPVVGQILARTYAKMARSLDKVRSQDDLYRENGRIRSELHAKYKYGESCNRCSVKAICDGFHGDYEALFGTGEATPIQLDQKIEDPRYYISRQTKIIEPEDESWALSK